MTRSDVPIIFESARIDGGSYLHTSFYHLKKEETRFLHYHDVLELGLCLEGSGECLSAGGSEPFTKGDVQFILPYQPHYDTTGSDGALWVFINVDIPRVSSPHLSPDPAFLIELAEGIRAGGVFRESEAPSVTALIRDIATLAMSEASAEAWATDLITAKLVSLLLELSVNDVKNAVVMENEKRSRVILPAIRLVSNELERQRSVSVAQMAESCFMSESYFRKIFCSIMGESPKSYAVRMQIRKAARLLISTQKPISEIARRCGFEDGSTFYRRFVDAYGMSPTEYREREGR